jgi:hypothetical protein
VDAVNLLKCGVCSYDGEPDLGWQVFKNGTTHLRAECRKCGRYIQYLPQADAEGDPTVWVLAAPTKPVVDDEKGAPWYLNYEAFIAAIEQELAWAREKRE